MQRKALPELLKKMSSEDWQELQSQWSAKEHPPRETLREEKQALVVSRPTKIQVPRPGKSTVKQILQRSGVPKRKGGNPKKKKGWRDYTAGDAVDLASKAWQLSKYLASLVNVEIKVFDIVSTATPDFTGLMFNLSNITQGTDINQRDGDSVLAVYSRLAFYATPNSTTGRNLVRAIVFQDMQQDGVDPTSAQLLEVVGSAGAPISPHNYLTAQQGNDRIHRFKIVHEVLVNLVTNSSTDLTHVVRETRWKGGSNHVFFDAAAGADASNREGAFFLLFVSDQAANVPSITFHHRLMYADN